MIAEKMIGTLPAAEYKRRLGIVSTWSRHVNERQAGMLEHYAGDLVYDGFLIATHPTISPVLGVLRDYGSQLVVEPVMMEACAKVNPPSDKVQWFLYDPDGRHNGWEGAFVPCTVEEARQAFSDRCPNVSGGWEE